MESLDHVEELALFQPEAPPYNMQPLMSMGEPEALRRGVGLAEGRRPCVLIADDDLDIVRNLNTVFRNLDVETHFVGDGRAALYAARHFLPDLFLLDLGMPVMGGMDVLRSLRNDPGTSGLATVLLTGSANPIHVKEGADLGAVAYILKPFSHLDITLKLKALLATHCGTTVEDRFPDGNFYS
jgi:CheY-like chemotaxis protein